MRNFDINKKEYDIYQNLHGFYTFKDPYISDRVEQSITIKYFHFRNLDAVHRILNTIVCFYFTCTSPETPFYFLAIVLHIIIKLTHQRNND